jgi:NTP pyrophosphatase (non-canonical NTP hydrolase)
MKESTTLKGVIHINKQAFNTEEIQEKVDAYISQFKEGYFSPLAQMARLTEEIGELAREVNHYHGEKPKKATDPNQTVEEELGDVLFVLVCFANSLNIDLSKAFGRTMDKFESRDKDRWTKKTDKDMNQRKLEESNNDN